MCLKKWKEVRDKLIAERNKINTEPPIELKKLYAGIAL